MEILDKFEGYINNIKFPAKLSEIVEQVKSNKAPDEVVNMFRQLKDQTYQDARQLKEEITAMMP